MFAFFIHWHGLAETFGGGAVFHGWIPLLMSSYLFNYSILWYKVLYLEIGLHTVCSLHEIKTWLSSWIFSVNCFKCHCRQGFSHSRIIRVKECTHHLVHDVDNESNWLYVIWIHIIQGEMQCDQQQLNDKWWCETGMLKVNQTFFLCCL